MLVDSGTISSRGEMTLPDSFRRHLHLEPGDKVVMHCEGHVITLRKAEMKPDSNYIRCQECLLEEEWDDSEENEMLEETAVL